MPIIPFIENAIECHHANSHQKFSNNFDQFELLYAQDRSVWMPYVDDFLDCWLDAWNHDWMYHTPITKDDWPAIAQEIISQIKSNSPFHPITFKGNILNSF